MHGIESNLDVLKDSHPYYSLLPSFEVLKEY